MNSSLKDQSIKTERTALIAQALAHPIRLEILQIIGEDGAYFMHIASILNRPQANLSQHLMVLREAGLVEAEREGMTVCYHLTDPGLLDLLNNLYTFAERNARVGEFSLNRCCQRGRANRHECHCPRCKEKII